MADYYPLIARAIAGLDPNAPGEARRALYARARTALIQQLRGVQPPLSESEITRERLSLEEAVRKVESEAAQRAREASRPGGAAAVRGSRANARPPEPGPADTAARPRPPADPRPPRNPRPDTPPPAPPRPQNPPGPETQAPPVRPGPPRRGPEGAPPPVPPAAPGVRGFRDITADADDLGRAAAQASRNARKTYANVPSPSPEFDRLEPSLENRGGDPEAPYSYDESIEEAERYTPQPPQGPPPQRSRAGNGEREPKKPPRVGSMFPFKTAIVIGILLILVGTGILFRQQAMTLVSSLLKSSAPVEAPKDAASTPASKKITDRVGQPSSSGETVAPVAQRVVLYDEDPSDPKGKQYVGSVVWRTEQVKGSGNQKPDIAVRADIDIPDRKFKMTMSFRRNTDSSLPASHTAELTFILPQDFANGGVGNVPGILMKSNEQARGTPLAGLAVKVTDGFFLVGLSNVDADRSRNLQLLKERSWFDVPLVYTNQRRAIIAIEKGAPGERAFNEAFAAWGE
ncbi:hypothetical protein J2R76_006857 [Bradyrhizobium sp. USDA 4532]|uniref:hypothetical protein n=1 Tax=unclassified Bradyrhizobium TaxID=2631580 RepID=UPI00209D3CF5|nr:MULTISPECIES: hypothetical protein [unclassified Bradyrhizobium]MCP1830157.1 hypothetical protein [Bradyrhizobium sp. USDA 4545]MCP1923266.1 hypothetical protein [Bradyrhizobium sp. USDA 4532]